MNLVDIRTAKLADAPVLADLSNQLGYPTSSIKVHDRLIRNLESKEHVILVACLSDQLVVGWIHAFITYRIESGSFAELGGFVVDEKYRGRRIGNQLLDAVEEWVVDQGIEKLRIRSRSTRIDAHAFYERLGFTRTKEQNVFDKLLKENK